MSTPKVPEVEHIDGAQVLDDVRDKLTTFCVLPSPEHVDAVVLWIATTHALPAFDYAPRLVARSPQKRSGKSRLLEVVDAMSHDPLRAVNATVSAIFRSLGGEHPPTLLIDEADTLFGSRKVAENNEELRGLLNAGHQRGNPVLRSVGPNHTPTKFDVFAMAALAGIGRMPDTIEDRAVIVPMRRRKQAERVRPFRLRRDKPGLVEAGDRLGEWAAGILDELATSDPDLPVEDRAADTWAPLVAVADAAGGDWPERARIATKVLTDAAEAEDADDSMNVRLLADIRTQFAVADTSFIGSALLCERLRGVEDSPWHDIELNPSKLGRRLREFGISAGHNTTRTSRGYRLESFLDAFERYLPPDPRPKPSAPVPAAESRGKSTDTFDRTDTLKVSSASKVSVQNPHDSADTTDTDAIGQGDGSRCAVHDIPLVLNECLACTYGTAKEASA